MLSSFVRSLVIKTSVRHNSTVCPGAKGQMFDLYRATTLGSDIIAIIKITTVIFLEIRCI